MSNSEQNKPTIENNPLFDPFFTETVRSLNKHQSIGVVVQLLKNHPEMKDEIFDLLKEAVHRGQYDSVQKLLEEANIPFYPYHKKADSIDTSLIHAEDEYIVQQLLSFEFLNSTKPNLILYGLSGHGREDLACSLADGCCHILHSVRFIRYNELIELLKIYNKTGSNRNAYLNLVKCNCLFIDDFAGINLYDPDLMDSLRLLLLKRHEEHIKNLLPNSTGKKSRKPMSRSTIVTTSYPLMKWMDHFSGEEIRTLEIINCLYGSGNLLTIEESEV